MMDLGMYLGMAKYAAAMSGSKYVIGRERWESLVINKILYGYGALAYYQQECDNLEVRQSGICRWFCDVGNIRSELIKGETG